MDNSTNLQNPNENMALNNQVENKQLNVEQVQQQKPETTNPAVVESAPVPGNSPAPPVMPTQPSQTTSTIPATQVHTSAVQSRSLGDTTDLAAEDEDLIEKPWVDKVEHIIDETQDDPRAEDEAHHQLSKMYLKKRFNLDIK